MGMKVVHLCKIFRNYDCKVLEYDVNKWFEENPDIVVYDVKFEACSKCCFVFILYEPYDANSEEDAQ